jgi:hypothetical protein
VTYHDPDSGLDFVSYDAYMDERMRYERWRGEHEPTVEEMCAARGHECHGEDSGRGRCYCGTQAYPEGGPDAEPG